MCQILDLPTSGARNRYVSVSSVYIQKVAEIVDAVHNLNYSKNRKQNWNCALIKEYYLNPKLDFKSLPMHGPDEYN